MPQFYTLLTDTGQAKLANAVALGDTIEITELAVGDGNGSLPTPDSSAESLINELRRAPINTSDTDPDNPSWIVVEQVLPPDVGGWTIREIGIFDVDGDLIGIGNYPETYKPVLAEGSSRTQTVRFVLEVSDTGAVTLKVDPSVVLATREYVDQERDEHEQSRNHPEATESAQGMVRYGTTEEHKAGTRTDRGAHLAGVLAAIHQYGLGKSVQLGGSDDLNDIEADGVIYSWSSIPPVNAPPGATYGVMLSIYDGRQYNQIVFGGSNPQFFQRRKNSGVWEDGWVDFRSASNLNAGTVPVERLPAASEQSKGGIALASQATTDGGGDDTKAITAKKLWNWVKQGTESLLGMFRVATDAQMLDATNDTVVVTPKKMLFGFSFEGGSSGYIGLPAWLGGLIIQWMRPDIESGSSVSAAWPIAFPTECCVAVANDYGSGPVYAMRINSYGATTVSVTGSSTESNAMGGGRIVVLGIGH
ncbi:phage tail-collar fiber domain-containing protein [Halomonas koreensis]|uniref:Phage tail protein n=1 Tax=Halomonas koreensis TaxID=245385 RepID=A0ABU1G570_9GAMM|nr:phage tail protein [Halomonas koreensis]MDR5868097.1 phage tail protein [Halomonas koreensis]